MTNRSSEFDTPKGRLESSAIEEQIENCRVSLDGISRIDSELAELVDRNLRASLHRVNDIPRSDGLWNQTNGRPTFKRVDDWARDLYRRNPSDLQICWTLFSVQLVRCGDPWQYFAPILRSDVNGLRFLISGALWYWKASGSDPSTSLREVLSPIPKHELVASNSNSQHDHDAAIVERLLSGDSLSHIDFTLRRARE